MGIRLVVIQPTSLCNLNCTYCYVADRKNASRMQPETLERIFQLTLRSSLLHDPVEFLWHAGEPLTMGVDFYRQAFALAKKHNVRGRQIKQAVQTNGTLIDVGWCRLFREHDVNVGISIDGPAFLHDGARVNWGGRGSHAQAVRGLKLLQDYGINTGGIAVLTERSLDSPDEVFGFFLEHGFSWIGFNVEEIEHANRSSSLHAQAAAGRVAELVARYRRFMERLFDLWVEHNRKLEIREFFLKCRAIAEKEANPEYVYERDELRDLGIVTFLRNGDMGTYSPELAGGPSQEYANFVVGNIHQMRELDEFLQSDNYRRIASGVHEGIRNCAANCRYFDLCGGGSPSNKFFENGALESTETITCLLHQQTVASVVIDKLRQASAVQQA